LLLTVIRRISVEVRDVYERLRLPVSGSEPEQSSVRMGLLLICGICSDPESMVARTAFKLLEIIV
jgi:hypothetical protein